MKDDILRRILRFTHYRHAVPISLISQMEFNLAPDCEGDELGILWLRPRRDYPFYLREDTYIANQRQIIARQLAEDDHVVAVAILRQTTKSPPWDPDFFERRLWKVKSYDAFEGYMPDTASGHWYQSGGPGEAVIPQSITPNRKSRGGWNPGDRTKLRRSNATEPRLYQFK